MNWRKVKAEYIAGGISQRKLADKYGISWNTLRTKANDEKWTDARKKAEQKALQKAEQKTAELVVDNATRLERIKTKILEKLEGMVDAYTENATEYKTVKAIKGGKGKKPAVLTYKMRDLAAVYESLSDKANKPGQGADVEDLSPLAELLNNE